MADRPQAGQRSWEGEMFRLLVENVKDYAIFIVDPGGRVQTWSAGAERLLGYREGEVIGQPGDRFFTPEDVENDVPRQEMRQAPETGRGEDDRWHVRKDGSRFWSSGVMTPLHDEGGTLRGFAKIMRDRTDFKRAEDARNDALAYAESILETVREPLVVLDGDLRVRTANRSFYQTFRVGRDETEGRLLYDLGDGQWDIPALRNLLEEILPQNTAFDGFEVAHDFPGVGRKVILLNARRLYREGNHTELILLAIEDITERRRAEDQRRELETRFTSLVKNIKDHSIFTLDPAGHVTSWNVEAASILGYSEEEILGRHYSLIFTPDDVRHGLPEWELRTAMEEGRAEDERWHVRKNGELFWALGIVTPTRDASGRHTGYSKILRDMTDRKRAEEALRQEREWLHVTLASIGDAVIATDPEGRVTFLNSVAEALTGWRQEEAQGRPLESVFPIIHERTRTPVEHPVVRVIREGTVVGLGNHTVLVARDGTERPIDDSAAPIRDAQGNTVGAVLIFRDVIGQRQSERELRASEARKAAVLETALDAIITIDHGARVIEFNPAAERMFGYSRAEALGRDIGGLVIPPRLREAHHRGMAHYLATGEGPVLGKRIEMPALRADGSEFPVELAITRIPTDGRPVFTAYLRDISERTRSERHRNARLAVTQVLAQAGSVPEAGTGLLRAVCESLGWDVGFFWTLDGSAGVLRCLESWHLPGVQATAFEATSRERTFGKGEGLPGHVWATGKPAWILDVVQDANFPRVAAAAQEGLHGAFACPVVGSETLGVIEFFSRQIREPDADLLEMMGTVAGQVGQFMERKLAEERLRRSERELADFFETASIGLHWVGPDGTILRANRAELDLLGYPPEEYVGHHISEFHADPDVICDILRRLQAGERLNDYPARMRCKDGSLRDVLIHSSVLFEEGRFVHTRCFTRDITEQKRAEQALRASEERFRGLMEQAPFSVQVFAPDGRTVRVNRAWEELWGVTLDQIADYNILHDPQLDAKGVTPYIQRAFAGEAVTIPAIEYDPNETLPDRTRHQDPRRWVSAVAYPLKDQEGRVREVVLVHEDITARRRAEEEVRFQAHLLDAVGQAAVATAPDGTIIYWNRFAETLYGWPKDEALGRNVVDVVVAPAAAEQAAGIMERLRAGQSWSGEFLVRRRDGTTFPAFVTDTPVFDGQRQLQAIIGISADITERKRVEEALRFLADASATLAALVDYESTLQKVAGLAVPHFADWCAVDLAEPDGSLSRLAVAHTDPAKVKLAHELDRRYPPDPDAPHGAYHVLRTGGSEMMADIPDAVLVEAAKGEDHLRMLRELGLKSFMCVPLRARGKTLGVVTFVTAESGRRYTEADLAFAEELARRAAIAIENARLYAELREADRLKDEFLAMLAHELRNPLAPIRNALHIMKQPAASGAAVEQVRGMAERQVQHMARLLDDLLDVSRISRGKIELRKAVLDVTAVVNRSVEAVRPLFEQRQHQLTVSLPPEPIRVEADPTRLEQVLTNLLTNAAKYTDPGGKVWLTAEREGGEVVLLVKDTGIGIDPAMLPRIFDLFVQAERRLDRSQGGVGIGLTLVRRLVELHGGAVEARSAGPGQGSEFVVRLPAAPDGPAAARAGDESAEAASPRIPSRRVLVVDDNVDAADSIAMLLKLAGQEVRVAYDGPTALLVAQAFRPQVVLLDIGMPGMDGYEVARRVRGEPALRDGLLVALTGWGQEEDRRRSAEAGFDRHLIKPVEPKSLEELLADPKLPKG